MNQLNNSMFLNQVMIRKTPDTPPNLTHCQERHNLEIPWWGGSSLSDSFIYLAFLVLMSSVKKRSFLLAQNQVKLFVVSRCLNIEFKSYEDVVAEGGNKFTIEISQRGRDFLPGLNFCRRSVIWLMKTLEELAWIDGPSEFTTMR